MSEPSATTLLPRATCPHCWHIFEPQDSLWIASHPTLRGDPRLQGDAYRRFLPSRFTVKAGRSTKPARNARNSPARTATCTCRASASN